MPTTASPAFASLELDPRLLSALTALGYEEPTPIQQQAIPPLLEGRDVLGVEVAVSAHEMSRKEASEIFRGTRDQR